MFPGQQREQAHPSQRPRRELTPGLPWEKEGFMRKRIDLLHVILFAIIVLLGWPLLFGGGPFYTYHPWKNGNLVRLDQSGNADVLLKGWKGWTRVASADPPPSMLVRLGIGGTKEEPAPPPPPPPVPAPSPVAPPVPPPVKFHTYKELLADPDFKSLSVEDQLDLLKQAITKGNFR